MASDRSQPDQSDACSLINRKYPPLANFGAGARHRGSKARGRKQVFFEKKNQKTFANWTSVFAERPQPKQSKVFCFFFSRTKSSLPFLSPKQDPASQGLADANSEWLTAASIWA
jgi:hypothetical protein